jgi:hypothetical protein
MNAVAVELVGTSPMLHNRCWTRGEDPGWQPKSDMEQAENRLHRLKTGPLYLQRHTPVIAIGRAAWSKGLHGAHWPREVEHARQCRSLWVERVGFRGDWKPHVFTRDGLPLVALPRFDRWTATFTLEYDPHHYRAETLRKFLEHSGEHIGLPQFAPFAGRGPWGRFEVATWEPVRVDRLEEIEA